MVDVESVTALVPIKEHSRRIPKKNFRPFVGEPLYFHILRMLQGVDQVGRIIIDTDSPRVASEAPKHFSKVRTIDRPEHLRGDTISMNRVIEYDISQVRSDLYLQTHTTNPLLRPQTIGLALHRFRESSINDSLFGVNRFQNRFYDQEGRAINHDPSQLLQTQDLRPVYEENSCIYLFTSYSFAVTGARIGVRPLMFEVPRWESVDIDDEEGWGIAEALASVGQKNLPNQEDM